MTKTGIQVKPIRTKEDYREAVARIEKLMSAEFGTPEGDELDVLATLVDAYEAKHFPMDAPDPVAAIEFMMEQQGLTRKDLEPMITSREFRRVLIGNRIWDNLGADIRQLPQVGRPMVELNKAELDRLRLQAGVVF